jgi:endogenous inhibitor of DNA gyrase (YacG/DUF329 family)
MTDPKVVSTRRQEFDGRPYHLGASGYFQHVAWKRQARGTKRQVLRRRFLHRDVWELAHGEPVPKGHTLQHVNFDRTDNRVANLEALPDHDHNKLHAHVRALYEEHTGEGMGNHHSRPRERVTVSCEVCKKEFQTFWHHRRFCSRSCQKSSWKERNRERYLQTHREEEARRRARKARRG